MPYGDSPTGQDDFISSLMRIDWKSALFGGAVMMAAAYLGVMRPASRQITALETQVSRLAASVESLNDSRTGVTRATSLLGRIEAQAARLAAAEAAVARYEALGSRLVTQAPAIAAAGEALDGIESLHGRIAEQAAAVEDVATTIGEFDELALRVTATREAARATVATVGAVHDDLTAGAARLAAAGTAADRLTSLARSLADRDDETAAARACLDQLAALQDRLIRTATDLDSTDTAFARVDRLADLQDRLLGVREDFVAADEAITRLSDISSALADASGTLGQLQRFVVDVVLLEPTFHRAVRALEPVVEFTAAGRRLEVKAAGDEGDGNKPTVGSAVREVARVIGEESR